MIEAQKRDGLKNRVWLKKHWAHEELGSKEEMAQKRVGLKPDCAPKQVRLKKELGSKRVVPKHSKLKEKICVICQVLEAAFSKPLVQLSTSLASLSL